MHGAVVSEGSGNPGGRSDDFAFKPDVLFDQALAFLLVLHSRKIEEPIEVFQGGGLDVERVTRLHLRGELNKMSPARGKMLQSGGLESICCRDRRKTKHRCAGFKNEIHCVAQCSRG